MTKEDWKALDSEGQHAVDLEIPCPDCLAETGAECEGLALGVVHFARRLKVLIEKLQPGLLEPKN